MRKRGKGKKRARGKCTKENYKKEVQEEKGKEKSRRREMENRGNK